MHGKFLHNLGMIRAFLLFSGLLILTVGCTPIGIATGAGAALGVAAAQDGGIRGAADDVRIKALVSDRWFRYDLDTFAKLSLNVNQGRVLITGVVQDPEDRVEAVRLAWQVEGVTQVINEIRLADGEGLPGYVRDKWISTRLRTEMTFDADIRSINYSIETVQGTVYLMGVARNQAELDAVLSLARSIPEVKEVISYVRMVGEQPAPAAAQSQGGWTQPQFQPQSQPLSASPVEAEALPP